MSDMALTGTEMGSLAPHGAISQVAIFRVLNRHNRRVLISAVDRGLKAQVFQYLDSGPNSTIWLPKNKSNEGYELTSEIERSRTSDQPTYKRKPNAGSVIFHWLSAILVFTALLAGIYAVYYAGCCSAARTSTFLLHAYAGLSLLGLVVVRLVFRAFFPWPHAEKKERFDPGAIVATVIHWLLYVMMLMIPLTGWIVASAMGCCVYVPGLPNVNELSLGMTDVNLADVSAAYQVHVFMAWTIMALISMHVAAALFHHFILKNDALKRMLPGRLRITKVGASSNNCPSNDRKRGGTL